MPRQIRAGLLHIDMDRARVWYDGYPVPVTYGTLTLLRALAERPGVVRTYEQLSDLLRRDTPATDDSIKSLVKKLRRDLRPVGADGHIGVIYGLGYRWVTA
jgi:two-component system response regulator ChvI